MSGTTRSVAFLAALGLAALPAMSADAAALKRNLNCATIYLVLTTPLGGTTNSSSVVMKIPLTAMRASPRRAWYR